MSTYLPPPTPSDFRAPHVSPSDPVEKPVISMPSVCADNLYQLDKMIANNDVLFLKKLGSQGFYASPDKRCAYSHESSIPLLHFYCDGIIPWPGALNMDRGDFTEKADGSHSACLADGVAGYGLQSTFVAEKLSKNLIESLIKSPLYLTGDKDERWTQVKDLFVDCFEKMREQIPPFYRNQRACGGATLLFADCTLKSAEGPKKIYTVNAGALGDGAIIHLNSTLKKASQLNEIFRKLDNNGRPDITDPGGHISSYYGIISPHNIEAVSIEIPEDDFIILVTDGFLDNVRDGKTTELVELVAFSPFFDQPFDTLLPYTKQWVKEGVNLLPTVEELQESIQSTPSTDEKLTAEKITQRLAAYAKLVTYIQLVFENQQYEKIYKCMINDTRENRLEQQTARWLLLKNRSRELPGKPKIDDCMIITITPGSY